MVMSEDGTSENVEASTGLIRFAAVMAMMSSGFLIEVSKGCGFEVFAESNRESTNNTSPDCAWGDFSMG
jgi:hypothetical protein